MVALAWSVVDGTSLSAASARPTTTAARAKTRASAADVSFASMPSDPGRRLACREGCRRFRDDEHIYLEERVPRFEPRVPRERRDASHAWERFYRTHSGVGSTGGGGREISEGPSKKPNAVTAFKDRHYLRKAFPT